MKKIIPVIFLFILAFSSKMYNVSPPNGHPFLEASGVLDWHENKCIASSLDLITGETIVNHTHCYIFANMR